MTRTTRAVVMLGTIPVSIHDDQRKAEAYLEQIADDRLEGVAVVWPVPVNPEVEQS